MNYDISYVNDEPKSIAVVFEAPLVADWNHPNFLAIIEAAKRGAPDEEIRALFNIETSISKEFAQLSNHVAVQNGRVYYLGEQLNNGITDKILEMYRGKQNFLPMVRFLEKTWQNPFEPSRENLFRWLDNLDFKIHMDGDFIAYKGVNRQGNVYKSVNSGTAYVDGVKVSGRIPNAIGSVISMPREQVVSDPNITCSIGLHAGTRAFARTFGSVVLEVKINPKNAVSVPVDANNQKLRVCEYEVIGVAA